MVGGLSKNKIHFWSADQTEVQDFPNIVSLSPPCNPRREVLLSPLYKQKAGFQRHSKTCPRPGNLRSVRVKLRCIQLHCYAVARTSICFRTKGHYIFWNKYHHNYLFNLSGLSQGYIIDWYLSQKQQTFRFRLGDGTSQVKALANLATGEEDVFPELQQMPVQGVSMR